MQEMNYGCGTTVHPRDLVRSPKILYVGVGGGMELLQFAYFSRQKGEIPLLREGKGLRVIEREGAIFFFEKKGGAKTFLGNRTLILPKPLEIQDFIFNIKKNIHMKSLQCSKTLHYKISRQRSFYFAHSKKR